MKFIFSVLKIIKKEKEKENLIYDFYDVIDKFFYIILGFIEKLDFVICFVN